MATGPEAGWYDDGTGKQRWWDGARWSDEYVDLSDPYVELRTGGAPVTAAAAEGWYDDARGRMRWWDGARWTDAVRFSGSEESFAGLTVDGRWIHFGAASMPIVGATAIAVSGAELLRRARLSAPAIARTLLGPAGPITPQLLRRSVDPAQTYLLVEVGGQTWLATVPPGGDARARQFATWIGSVSEHYRYR